MPQFGLCAALLCSVSLSLSLFARACLAFRPLSTARFLYLQRPFSNVRVLSAFSVVSWPRTSPRSPIAASTVFSSAPGSSTIPAPAHFPARLHAPSRAFAPGLVPARLRAPSLVPPFPPALARLRAPSLLPLFPPAFARLRSCPRSRAPSRAFARLRSCLAPLMACGRSSGAFHPGCGAAAPQGDHDRLGRCRQVGTHPAVHVQRLCGGLRPDQGRQLPKEGRSECAAGHRAAMRALKGDRVVVSRRGRVCR